MPRQTEPNANNALGNLLRRMMPGCTVRSENTQTFIGHAGLHPDVLITAPGRAPVVVEAEYEPAPEAEKDAKARLGLRIEGDARAIEAAIALRYPPAVENAYDLAGAVAEANLSYCVLYENDDRFPEKGWLQGSVDDLADLIRLVSVPQKEVDRATERLEKGIDRAAAVLDAMAELKPSVAAGIAKSLGMSDVPETSRNHQTRRMACAILANALIFHERIAGMHADVKPLRLLDGPGDTTLQDATLAAWTDILNINYYPIFSIAKDLLVQLPSGDAAQVLDVLRPVAQGVDAAGVDQAHDLTGRIFQRLIADRKYLATFYTRPESAALLARLAVAKLEGVDWADDDALSKLRVGDFACGTGALLSAVYDRIAANHERAGGDPAKLHPALLEEVLYGCDVMPSAVHITGATLAGAQPNVDFGESHLYTMPYGRQTDGSVKIGSLELLQSSSALTLFNTSNPALRTGGAGEETAAQVNIDIPDKGFDLVIMNPPFTRNVTHEGEYAGTHAAAFAALGSSESDQKEMSKRLDGFKKDTCYHGSAGMASAFVALADKKLKPGGVLALVLPLSASAGISWEKFRQLLVNDYDGLEVVSIAANGKGMSFSSDTGMAECLVVARKLNRDEKSARQPRFISLLRRPGGFAHAAEVAKGLRNAKDIRSIDDGPYGGTLVTVGSDRVGEIALGDFADAISDTWNCVRLKDVSVAQVAQSLTFSKLWLPTFREPFPLQLTTLSAIAGLGKYHLSIIGNPPQGCFTKTTPSPTATYPALWNHDAKKETRMICEPDSQLIVRQGMETNAAEVWATASYSHLNLDFTYGSQALAVASTEFISIGGRVWPNVIFDNKRFDHAFTVWGNSTLGLLAWWWHSNRQQSSKGGLTILSARTLHVLDLRALSTKQLAMAEEIFEEFRDKELLPAYLADADPNRALLDRRVVCDLLGFDAAVYQGVRRLAAKWCAEPSVHGGKQRPRGAALVV